jgi:UDP-N-acetylglucosamine acyltransferase
MPQIHPLAFVHPNASLAEDVTVGPFAYIGADVTLGKGCIVHHHAQIEGNTAAGENNEFFPNCYVGAVSQDLKYRGGACRLIIGKKNVFREFCTVHIGTEDGGGYTRIGDHNLIMVAAHIAHDCSVGSNTILANNVMLAGHVEVQDWVVISGGAASHHFVRFGQHSFIGGLTAITHDVPPFMVVDGPEGKVRAVNTRGLARRGFNADQLACLKTAYRLLFRDSTPMSTQALELERRYPDNPEIQTLLAFVRESSNGKFGRAREALRGKGSWNEEDDPPPHVSGH